MSDEDVETVSSLINKAVQYKDEYGRIQVRVLEEVYYSDNRNCHMAKMKYKAFWKRWIFQHKKIPLRDIVLPKRNPIRPCRDGEELEVFNWQTHRYTVYNSPNFKKGCEVVLKNHSTPEAGVVVGRVLFTARTDHVINSDKEEIAILSLDQPPPAGVPSFNLKSYNQNSVILYQNELLTLEEWVLVNEDPATLKNDNNQLRSVSVPSKGGSNDVDVMNVSAETSGPSIDNGQISKDSRSGSLNLAKVSNMVENTGGDQLGIQGHNNSCYLDSTIFTLFAFINNLDKFIQRSSTTDVYRAQISKRLRRHVVPALRNDFFVSHEEIGIIREILASSSQNANYLNQLMDAEECISDLLEALKVPNMISYGDENEDHIHQIMLPLDWQPHNKVPVVTLQTLLDGSLNAYDVRVAQLHSGLLIVKLPVCNGQLVVAKAVIPNLILKLPMRNSGDSGGSKLTLKAVMCLKNSHYTTFVRCLTEKDDAWVFADSSPQTGLPYIKVLSKLSAHIEFAEAVYSSADEALGTELLSQDESISNGVSIFANAYICVYTI